LAGRGARILVERHPARALGVQLQVLKARTPSEIEAAFAAMSSQRAGGVLVLRDAVFLAQRTQLAALAAKSRLPAVYGLREEAEAGGLMAYGASAPQMFRRAATYVDISKHVGRVNRESIVIDAVAA
jgi:putative ABC transport system substrate-binding protein